MIRLLIPILSLVSIQVFSQDNRQSDSLPPARTLDSITIKAFIKQGLVEKLPNISGTYLFSGKKTESINLNQTPANLADQIGQ